MLLPKYNQTNSQERLGVNAVAELLVKLGQIWRETPMADVGIDGQVEYVNPEGYATGRMIALQIKSGPSFFKKKDDSWVFYPEKKHQFYWEHFPIPVFIVIHNPETNISYWQNIRYALKTSKTDDSKGILIPKSNILQTVNPTTLFEEFAVTDQPYMSPEEIIDYLINTKNQNSLFPISYFNLFCGGLTNICRSIYFGIDIALTIAESNLESSDSEFGLYIGQEDHYFLFEFVKFLVNQHIADINFSDCMIDWYDRELQPSFIAPLTSRGREIVQLIDKLEASYVKDKRLSDNNGLHAAQETPVSMSFGMSEFGRISIVNKIQDIYSKKDT
jgi:hypothetical protein